LERGRFIFFRMKEVIAVFDIGKTNKKVLLFDSSFQVVFQHGEKFPVVLDDDGFECDDIDLITTWISRTLKEIISKKEYHLLELFNLWGIAYVS